MAFDSKDSVNQENGGLGSFLGSIGDFLASTGKDVWQARRTDPRGSTLTSSASSSAAANSRDAWVNDPNRPWNTRNQSAPTVSGSGRLSQGNRIAGSRGYGTTPTVFSKQWNRPVSTPQQTTTSGGSTAAAPSSSDTGSNKPVSPYRGYSMGGSEMANDQPEGTFSSESLSWLQPDGVTPVEYTTDENGNVVPKNPNDTTPEAVASGANVDQPTDVPEDYVPWWDYYAPEISAGIESGAISADYLGEDGTIDPTKLTLSGAAVDDYDLSASGEALALLLNGLSDKYGDNYGAFQASGDYDAWQNMLASDIGKLLYADEIARFVDGDGNFVFDDYWKYARDMAKLYDIEYDPYLGYNMQDGTDADRQAFEDWVNWTYGGSTATAYSVGLNALQNGGYGDLGMLVDDALLGRYDTSGNWVFNDLGNQVVGDSDHFDTLEAYNEALENGEAPDSKYVYISDYTGMGNGGIFLNPNYEDYDWEREAARLIGGIYAEYGGNDDWDEDEMAWLANTAGVDSLYSTGAEQEAGDVLIPYYEYGEGGFTSHVPTYVDEEGNEYAYYYPDPIRYTPLNDYSVEFADDGSIANVAVGPTSWYTGVQDAVDVPAVDFPEMSEDDPALARVLNWAGNGLSNLAQSFRE